MANDLPLSTPTPPHLNAPGDEGAGARAVRIGTCFGWHHRRRGALARWPVVLCAPIGVEALATHLGWRALAERLAAAGHDVIRFDYHGTGLSPGEWLDAAPLIRWQTSIAEAITAARAVSGATKVILIGLRLGASLAALAAQNRDDIIGFAGLAPISSGQRYLRELTSLAQMQGAAGQSPSGLAVHGFELAPALMEALATLNPGALPPPAPAGFIAIHTAAEAKLAAAWGYETQPFAGFEAFTENPTHATAPEALLAHTLAWCAALGAAEITAAPLALGAARFEHGDGSLEEAVAFGEGQRLAGVHFRPGKLSSGLGVLIANAGRNPAAGWGRQGVELARRLAREGHGTLLFDFSGVGDSAAPPGAQQELLYSSCHIADIGAAVQALKARGYAKVFIVGACSSAFAALHAASSIAELAGLALINQLLFHWKPGTNLDTVVAQTRFRPTEAYKRRFMQRETWMRLLRGEIALVPIATTISARLLRRIQRPLLSLLDRLGLFNAPEREALGWFQALEKRGVRVVIINTHEDPSLAEFSAYFGAEARALAPMRQLSRHLIEGGDHSFSRVAGRQALHALLAEVIAQLDQTPEVATKAAPRQLL